MFFGGMGALMVAVVLLTKANRGIQALVERSSTARIAFGFDVSLFSLALAGLITRFFILNTGYKPYLLLHYLAMAVIAIAATGCAVLGVAVAANLKSPAALFTLLQQLNKDDRSKKAATVEGGESRQSSQGQSKE